MARRLRITIDYNACVGSSICVHTAPNVFALDENGQSSLIDPQGDREEKILEAAEGCPTMAIVVEDAETRQRLFPPL